MTDPRKESSSSCFNHFDVYDYIKKKNKNAIVVHRINECDERKNTKGVNDQIIKANQYSDSTVFISTWLKNNFSKYKNFSEAKVICNGASLEFFFNGSLSYNKNESFKLVTHQWSSHINKGFDIYKMIDDKLNDLEFRDKISFTIIGNIPENIKFTNINHIRPLFDKDLGDALRNNHAYVTASKNEPGGNHQNEGINCGLPVLYLNSGCMREYCEGYGIEFNKDNIFLKIFELIQNYDFFKKKTKEYKFNHKYTCQEYLNLFVILLNDREKIVKKRNWSTIPLLDQFKNKLRRII